MSMPSRVALFLGLSVLASSCAGGDTLNTLEPRLQADRTRASFPDGDLGQVVTTEVFLSNPGGGTTHFSARVDPPSSGVVLDTRAGQVTHAQGVRLVLSYLGVSSGTVSATLVVDHDGQPGDDGTAHLVLPVMATTRPPPNCDDHNPCTLDAVDFSEPSRCSHQPMAGTCDDGNACTSADHCDLGSCVGTAVVCDDGISCTADHCDPAAGCVYLPRAAACDDADPCTVDTCVPAAPVAGCTHSVAPNGTQCGAVACDLVSMCVAGACVALPTPEGYPCDDGDPCTRGEACHAGVCVPAEGGPSTLGPPVLITNAFLPDDAEQAVDGGTVVTTPWTGDSRIAGQWPVALDGLLTVPRYSQPAFDVLPDVMLLWRGVANSGGDYCYQNPASCTETGSCSPSGRAPLSTQLLLTHADSQGRATSTLALDVDTPYRQAAMLEGINFDAGRRVPSSTVLNVAVASQENRLVGAALVAFADGCEGCLQPQQGVARPPTPPQQDVDAGTVTGTGTAAPPCMPAGNMLITFEVGVDSLRPLSARWLGPNYYQAALPNTLLTQGNQLPMLAVTIQGSELGVAYGTSDGCGDYAVCDAAAYAAVHVLVFPLDFFTECAGAQCGVPTNTNATRDYQLSVAINGQQPMGHVTLTGANWCLNWTQPTIMDTGLVPAQCSDGEPMVDAWTSCAISDDRQANPRVTQAFVKDRLPQDDGSVFTWTRAWTEACVPVDNVVFSDVNGAALHQASGTLHLQSATSAMVLGSPVFLASDASGLVWGVRTDGTRFSGGFDVAADVRLSPHHPPRAQSNTAATTVGSVAEVGLTRNSLPTPALAILPWQCGTGLMAP